MALALGLTLENFNFLMGLSGIICGFLLWFFILLFVSKM